ncbi:hypothetical protein QOT17_023914 [Balamuthia mandrillaris]
MELQQENAEENDIHHRQDEKNRTTTKHEASYHHLFVYRAVGAAYLSSAVPVPPNNGANKKIPIAEEEELIGINCFDCRDDDSSDSDAGLPA